MRYIVRCSCGGVTGLDVSTKIKGDGPEVKNDAPVECCKCGAMIPASKKEMFDNDRFNEVDEVDLQGVA